MKKLRGPANETSEVSRTIIFGNIDMSRTDFRGVIRTQANIYDGDFFAKRVKN